MNKQLQLYDISDSVLNLLDDAPRVALVNVQGLMPLKMLYIGVEALFLVLLGGGLIHKSMQVLNGDVPATLSSGVYGKEQKDLCLGSDTGGCGVEHEAIKHDDAEVPTCL
jgi:hypothetical protein